MENRKKSLEQLQAELAMESEALATLQTIYAEKVKQVRINTALPPDIQARFLTEWETFYQQRVNAIFRKEYQKDYETPTSKPISLTASVPAVAISAPLPVPAPAPLPTVAPPPPPMASGVLAAPMAPIQKPFLTPPTGINPVSPAPPAPAMVSVPVPIAVMPPAPPMVSQNNIPTTPDIAKSLPPGVLNEDILGVNTGSWMNPAESMGYEQYNDNEPISSTLMDGEKINDDDGYDAGFGDDNDSIDGYAATSGLKGLTEFMDFDLKKKRS